MASGPDHYREAERLLADPSVSPAVAQVHATLALVAATALGGLSSGDWREVILREKRSEP